MSTKREYLLSGGWVIGVADVPVIAGWSVRIRSGRLVGLGADDEEQWPAPDPTPLPERWLHAATKHPGVLVLVVPPGTLDDDDARFDEGLIASVRAGSLVAGVLAIRLEDEE